MKAYTDLEQSKMLAEILPIDSADMIWCFDEIKEEPFIFPYRLNLYEDSKDIPAWSLAALLEQLDDSITNDDGNDLLLEIKKEGGRYYLYYNDRWGWQDDIETDYYDDLVDACVDMIIKLHEQKLI